MAESKKKETIKPVPGQLPVNQETLDILVANIIPTSKYFEVRFDHLEDRFERMQNDIITFRSDVNKRFDDMQNVTNKRFDDMQKGVDKRFDDMQKGVDKRFDDMQKGVDKRFDDMQSDVDKRFGQVDKQFEQVNKRFEQIDKRFEQIDKRFEQVLNAIDKLADKLDHRDERQRNFTLKMFTISITISILGVTGVFLKALSVF